MCCALVNVEKLTQVLIDACCTQFSCINCIKPIKFKSDVHTHCCFTHAHRHFNRPTRMEIPARLKADFRANNHRCTQIKKITSEVIAQKFTKFLQNIEASSPVLTPLCRWQYAFRLECQSKEWRRSVRCSQKAHKLIGYHSNVPWAISKQMYTHIYTSKLKV